MCFVEVLCGFGDLLIRHAVSDEEVEFHHFVALSGRDV